MKTRLDGFIDLPGIARELRDKWDGTHEHAKQLEKEFFEADRAHQAERLSKVDTYDRPLKSKLLAASKRADKVMIDIYIAASDSEDQKDVLRQMKAR